jgi:hypothetical protein
MPMTRRVHRTRRLAAAGACALAALTLAGCHASATVAIRVRADGSGTVTVVATLDREARLALAGAALSPTPLPPNAMPDVPLGDLRARGWSVSSWRAAADGGATIQLSTTFTDTAGLSAALAELDGPDGGVRDVHLVRERTLLRDHDAVSLLADLRYLHVGVADDAALAARLRAAGVDVAALDSGLQTRLRSSFSLSVSVELPDGTHATVRVVPGQERAVAVASTVTYPRRRETLVAAAAVAFLGLVLFAVAAVQARRARRARRAQRALDA